MTLLPSHKRQIEDVIKSCLRNKFQSYNPETKHMPFHHRLLGKDRMALFSFIHSLNTTFGISIFEPVAECIANTKFSFVQKQYVLGNKISEKAQAEIQNIMNDLTVGVDVDKDNEVERIRRVCRSGGIRSMKSIKADLFVLDENETVHLFDLKTAKPNQSNFKDFKRTLLEWTATYLYEYPEAEINTYIAIPYNPYEPKPYERWTLKGMLDLPKELKVAYEFWNFLGGDGAYEELLDCFERAGIALRDEIDQYFLRFK